MEIHGFAKTTLLDYPKHVACTLFTGGCNFRCPFCHNKDLVLSPKSVDTYDEEEIFAYLQKRKNILDGVCITGGEPTLAPDLKDFIRKIKALNLKVKLDSNGYRPEVLRELLEENLLNYVAMDIKNSPKKYPLTCGIASFDVEKISESIKLLVKGDIPFEFRTTVVSELHQKQDFEEIGAWIKGAPAYYLQSYRESDQVISPGFHPYDYNTLKEFQSLLQGYVPVVEIRGIDQ